MTIRFLNRFPNPAPGLGIFRMSGISTSGGALSISAYSGTSSVATPGDGYRYYTWSAPSTGSASGPVSFAGGGGQARYPLSRARGRYSETTVAGDCFVDTHGGSPGPTGGRAYGTFTAATLTSVANWYVDIGSPGSPNGGSHAGFFQSSKAFGNTYVIAGGGGSPAPATGNPGGSGGGPSGGGGSNGGASGGPGPSYGGGGASQGGAGGGGSGAPDRCPGQPGGQLSGGNLSGGDPSGRPGGGGGSGYYGGGAGGCGYSGDNNNPGSGGGGGSGYVHPSAQGAANQGGSSQGGARVVLRVLA